MSGLPDVLPAWHSDHKAAAVAEAQQPDEPDGTARGKSILSGLLFNNNEVLPDEKQFKLVSQLSNFYKRVPGGPEPHFELSINKSKKRLGLQALTTVKDTLDKFNNYVCLCNTIVAQVVNGERVVVLHRSKFHCCLSASLCSCCQHAHRRPQTDAVCVALQVPSLMATSCSW